MISVSSKKMVLLVLMVISFVAIGTGVVLLLSDSSNQNGVTVVHETTFFLKDSTGKYALFNEDGERITDFVYTSASSFVNGMAAVSQEDKMGIINSDAKMIVDFGKYDSITSKAGIYEVIDSDSKKYLINGNGKVLYNLDNFDLKTYNSDVLYSILEDDDNGKYYVLNSKGEALKSFDISSNKEISTSSLDNYISVSYNNKNYIFNSLTGDEVISFDDSESFCINKVSSDGSTLILNSCSSSNNTYKLLVDGKLINVNTECDRVFYNQFDRLTCEKDNVEYLLDDNYKKSLAIASLSYEDDKNYAKNNRTGDNSVEFYNNGSLVKSVTCRTLRDASYIYNDLYLLGTDYSRSCGTEAGIYEFYNSKGEKVFDKTFVMAENYDFNGNAKVSEDDVNYYLMNSEGEQVSSLYDDINTVAILNGYYTVTKNNLKGIIDKTGKEVIEPAYRDINTYNINDTIYAVMVTNDSKNVVYDLTNKKEIVTVDGYARLGEHYIYTNNNSKQQYYSYKNGKMFHEV